MKSYFKRLYKNSKNEFYTMVKNNLIKNNKMFIVTANPETFMIGKKNKKIDTIIMSENASLVADGIGLIKTAKLLNIKIEEKIAGVDLVTELLNFSNENNSKIYVYGTTKNILELFKNKLETDYPNIEIVGLRNGYDTKEKEVVDDIKKYKPDLVLVALGIPKQEEFIFDNYNEFKKGIFIGVGGSIDVISGYKKRAPKIFVNNNIEWLYRIFKEPNRLKRFYNNNIKFVIEILKEKVK